MSDQQTITDMRARLASQQQAFGLNYLPSLQQRYDCLDRIIDMTARYQSDIIEAINADFGGRSAAETSMVEVFGTTANARNTKRRLKRWMRTRKISTAPPFRPGYNRLMSQPLGVVGVISPWNIPYNLSMGPAIAALAAGNRVMLKPSEITPTCSELMRNMVHENFDRDEFDVFPGGHEVAAAFSDLPLDHLLYTGSTTVGKLVAQAAAKNLTPVTLELGGKSPAIIDESADLLSAAKRLAFAKMFNAGQVCVAPDYLLVPDSLRDEFANALLNEAEKLYPEASENRDYCSIVSDRHKQRLDSLLSETREAGVRVLQAGSGKANDNRRMPLHLLLDPDTESTVMQEEVFGPLLPLISYNRLEDAIGFVNARPRPLALYWFGSNSHHREQVLNQTISGGVTINDAIWHFAQEDQPFGGVGPSGMGAYHGEAGFRTFSKEKPIYHAPKWPYSLALLHPPYSGKTMKLLNLMRKLA